VFLYRCDVCHAYRLELKMLENGEVLCNNCYEWSEHANGIYR
jgi:formylmethanofuran dehydrogenase subunit E